MRRRRPAGPTGRSPADPASREQRFRQAGEGDASLPGPTSGCGHARLRGGLDMGRARAVAHQRALRPAPATRRPPDAVHELLPAPSLLLRTLPRRRPGARRGGPARRARDLCQARTQADARVGTGMMLGMLGFALVWLAEVPFGLASVWWERRHGVSHQGYPAYLLQSFLGLGGRFVFVSLALLVAMGLAGPLRRWWWVGAAPAFAALALLSTFLSIYLVPDTRPLRYPSTAGDVRTLAQAEGIPHTRAVVQQVSRYTTAPNAESVGFGSTRRVILWNTLLDGRFDRREIRVVIAHELGHLAHHHPLKRVGWLLLFLIPAAALVALLTRGRGGLSRPE